MGKQLYTELEGSFGPVIFYKSRGQYLIRSKGKTGAQAAVAKQQASVLGMASGLSARLRAACKYLLPDTGNRKLMYRLNNVLQQWLRSDPLRSNLQQDEVVPLKGFSLLENNYGSLLHEAIRVTRNAGEGVTVHIPAFNSPNPIAPLPFNGQIQIKIMVACCHIRTGMSMRNYETSLDITYTGIPIAARELPVPITLGAGELTVVAVSVNALAVGIVAAMWN